MAFARQELKKGFSLPGMIDIIFLLLIFSLVTLSFSKESVEAKKRGEKHVDFDLPEARAGETLETEEVFRTLLFQIENKDPKDPASPRIIYALWPSVRYSVIIDDAKEKAIQDSLFAEFPSNFLQMNDRTFSRIQPCSLITWAVREYKNDHFFEPSPTNTIEIRAVRTTEFRIINFIMETCSAYGDTIPGFVFRTLSGQEVDDGF